VWKEVPEKRETQKEELHLSASVVEGISSNVQNTSQISRQRETFNSKNLVSILKRPLVSQINQQQNTTNPKCTPITHLYQPTMPNRTLIEAVPAQIGAGAGLRLIPRDQETSTLNPNCFLASLKNMELEATASSAYRVFETPENIASTLNTPEVRNESTANNFDECFSSLLNESFNGTEEIQFVVEQDIMGLNTDYTDNVTLYNDKHNDMPNVNPMMEEVWGSESFDHEDFGPCLPLAEVEGVVDNPEEANNPLLEDENKDIVFSLENNDLLKWIIDDQQIDDPMNFDLNVIPEPSQNPIPEFVIEVKEEKPDLRDEDKYRKMREQNNEASRKCRKNRKRKLEDVEKEAEELEVRNKFLRAQMEDMEADVAKWKKKLLSDISNKAFIPNF